MAAINAVMGTIIAWVLVRDAFPGKDAVNALIDLPFALPTIVAGLTLIALYGSRSPLGINVAYTQVAVLLALLFVTLPFVVRAVQPVLDELDHEMEQAATALGASHLDDLPPDRAAEPAARHPGRRGARASPVPSASSDRWCSISGNIPFETEVAAVRIYSQVENDNVTAAAALAVVLLTISLAVLLAISGIERWSRKHDR